MQYKFTLSNLFKPFSFFKPSKLSLPLLLLSLLLSLFIGCSHMQLSNDASPLIDAAYDGDLNEVKRLIRSGADLNVIKVKRL